MAMPSMYLGRLILSLAIVGVFWVKSEAHFPWLAIDDHGHGLYFFGETLAERSYKLPTRLADVNVSVVDTHGNVGALPLALIESDDFIGKRSTTSVPPGSWLYAQATYGIHGGARLDYYTEYASEVPSDLDACPKFDSTMKLRACIGRVRQGIRIRVLWNEKPLPDAEVSLTNAKGDELAKKKTDDLGEVEFSSTQVETGLHAIRVGHKTEEHGTLSGRTYESASHYLTLSFEQQTKISNKSSDLSEILASSSELLKPGEVKMTPPPISDLPLELTSFGAVRMDDTIFVYGGHTGEAHEYSNQDQSSSLLSYDLDSQSAKWIVTAEGRRLQGLGLVSYGRKIIVVGGFEALNARGETHNLKSTSDVVAFDIDSGVWSALPPLPEPRSSLDAIVIDGTLYVVGGWTLKGEDTTWLTTGWSLNLSDPAAQWVELPKPDFQRRAISLASIANRLYVIGGMNEKSEPTLEVSYLDLGTRTWHEAPQLIGRSMNGFGTATCSFNGRLIVTTMDGDIQLLTVESDAWQKVGAVNDKRFFHRLLPLNEKELVAIGGANMGHGKFKKVEVIPVP